MRIIITGGAGFIGSNLIHYLLKHTASHILNVDRLTYAANSASLANVEANNRYQFSKTDIRDPEAMPPLFEEFQPDAIIHLAAESHVDRSIDGPHDFIQTNILGTFHLLQSTRHYLETTAPKKKKTFRFIHVSTDEVYGSLNGNDSSFNETTQYDPHSPYSASKAASDHLAHAWHTTYGLPTIVTHCSNNYGPYQFPEKLIPVVILNAIQGKPIPVYGNGEHIRDWLHVDDHARALWTILTKGQVGQTYNIGGDNEVKNIDLVRLICKILDEEKPQPNGTSYSELITHVTDRPGHDLRYAINNQKISTELNWSPQEDFKSGFIKTVRWYLENASNIEHRASNI